MEYSQQLHQPYSTSNLGLHQPTQSFARDNKLLLLVLCPCGLLNTSLHGKINPPVYHLTLSVLCVDVWSDIAQSRVITQHEKCFKSLDNSQQWEMNLQQGKFAHKQDKHRPAVQVLTKNGKSSAVHRLEPHSHTHVHNYIQPMFVIHKWSCWIQVHSRKCDAAKPLSSAMMCHSPSS